MKTAKDFAELASEGLEVAFEFLEKGEGDEAIVTLLSGILTGQAQMLLMLERLVDNQKPAVL
jgi:hypothetical protein